jgi:hypothetical protein
MKTRAGWRERHEVSHTAPDGPVIQIVTGVPRSAAGALGPIEGDTAALTKEPNSPWQ